LSVGEYEKLSGKRVLQQLRPADRRKAVYPFPEINRLDRQQDRLLRRYLQHGALVMKVCTRLESCRSLIVCRHSFIPFG